MSMHPPGATIQLKQLLQLRSLASKLSHNHLPLTATRDHYLSRQRGRGMDFDAVRRYQAGDDVRHIDWNVTARTHKTHSKLFCEERECPVLIAVDLNHSLFFGTRKVFKSVLAAQIAAILAWSSTQQGDRVGGLIQTASGLQCLPAKARQQGVLPLLKALSQSCQLPFSKHTTSLKTLLQNTAHMAKPSAIIYLLSDFYNLDSSSLLLLSSLAQRYSLRLGLIYDPLERHAPIANYYRFSDGNQSQLINLQDKPTRKHYENIFKQRHLQLLKFAHQHQLPLIELGTDQELKDHAKKL